jgi:hypothetical protein
MYMAPVRVSKRARTLYSHDSVMRPSASPPPSAAALHAAQALATADPQALLELSPTTRNRLGLPPVAVVAPTIGATSVRGGAMMPMPMPMPMPMSPPPLLMPPPPPHVLPMLPPAGSGPTMPPSSGGALGSSIPGSSARGLAPVEFLFPSNQSHETQLRIINRDKTVPVFRTPEAMYGKINEVVLEHPDLSDAEKVSMTRDNLARAAAMRSAANMCDLDRDELATVVKRSTVDQVTGKVDDPFIKQFEKRLTAEFDKKTKAEEKAKKKEEKAKSVASAERQSDQGLKEVASAMKSLAEVVTKSYGKGGKGGKGGKSDWLCWVCNETGHRSFDCPNGKGKGGGGKGA